MPTPMCVRALMQATHRCATTLAGTAPHLGNRLVVVQRDLHVLHCGLAEAAQDAILHAPRGRAAGVSAWCHVGAAAAQQQGAPSRRAGHLNPSTLAFSCASFGATMLCCLPVSGWAWRVANSLRWWCCCTCCCCRAAAAGHRPRDAHTCAWCAGHGVGVQRPCTQMHRPVRTTCTHAILARKPAPRPVLTVSSGMSCTALMMAGRYWLTRSLHCMAMADVAPMALLMVATCARHRRCGKSSWLTL